MFDGPGTAKSGRGTVKMKITPEFTGVFFDFF